MSNIIAVSNQKGGVGKTVTSVNLAYGLARHGKRVLLIDLDAQGSATLSLGFNPDKLKTTITDIILNIINDTPFEATQGILHHQEGIDLLPSNITLSSIEFELMNAYGRESILKNYLQSVCPNYDYIIIDCLPALNIFAVNALTAATKVLIPVQPQHLSINGMEQLLITIGKVKKRMNKSLEIIGILPTMVMGRATSTKNILKLLHNSYDGKLYVFKNYIPMSVRAAEFSIEGTSIYNYDKNGKVAIAYEKLTEEILETESHKEVLI